MATANPLVLSKFRAALDALFGPRIDRVVLFGSRARGDAQSDSDYDVAVFLNGLENRRVEADRIAVAALQAFDETGALIHALPYRNGACRERAPLMHEVRREGIDP
jgi:predicted nucleotidyltransferase